MQASSKIRQKDANREMTGGADVARERQVLTTIDPSHNSKKRFLQDSTKFQKKKVAANKVEGTKKLRKVFGRK